MPQSPKPSKPNFGQPEEETNRIIRDALLDLKADPIYQQLEPIVQEDTDNLVAAELRKAAKDPLSTEEVRGHQRFLLEERIPRHLQQMLSARKANEKMRSMWAKDGEELGLEPRAPRERGVKPKGDRQK